jgi:putative Holliday junction resolvase
VHCGKVLALDYGIKNVGLACCDELGVTVRPLASIPNTGRRNLIARLRTVIEENRIQSLVVGIPRNMDGSYGDSADRVERFMAALRQELGLPLSGVDERLSTVEAQEVWNEMRPRQQRKYRTVDSLAAAFILERFLRAN